MVLISILAGCSAPESAALKSDTSYPGFPALQQVDARCDGDDIVVMARTIGWNEHAQVEIWDSATPGRYGRAYLATVGFDRDETCDVMLGRVSSAAAPAEPEYTCADHTAGTLTYFVRVSYESGCAGSYAWGPQSQAVYDGTIEPAADAGGKCDAPPGARDTDPPLLDTDRVDACSVLLE